MNRYLQAAEEIAARAGELLLEEFAKPQRLEYKSGVDLVTAADRRAEEFIVEQLGTFFPGHAVVAEEGARRGAGSEFCWYVDPLDGTTNFAHGYPVFAVSLALAERDELLLGVVYDPTRREMFSAARGEGAFLNRKRIRVSDTRKLSESLLVTGFPTRKRHTSPNILYYQRFTLLSHGVRRDGSAALDLAAVAAGRFDAFWEMNLQAWDTAAGTLLVREAGGTVSDFEGRPFAPGGATIAASNARLHAELLEVLAEVGQRAASPLPF